MFPTAKWVRTAGFRSVRWKNALTHTHTHSLYKPNLLIDPLRMEGDARFVLTWMDTQELQGEELPLDYSLR